MSYRREEDSSDSDSEKHSQSRRGTGRSLNELLKRALEAASFPGEGDEEPVVLPDPNRKGEKYA